MNIPNSESNQRLFEVISRLDNADDVKAFLEDICTINEILDMAQRLDTAVLLDRGVSYNEIANEVKVSTATISRVSKCLNYGSGGYRVALSKLTDEEKSK